MIKVKLFIGCLVISLSLSAQKLDVRGQKMDTVRISDSVNTISVKDGNDLLNLYYTKQYGLTVTPQEYDLLKQFVANLQAITNNKRYKIIPHK